MDIPVIDNELAPVILFIYNRPEHTRKTLEALSENILADQSVLYVFADGPRVGADKEELRLIEQARAVFLEKKWCKDVILTIRERNMNLEDNIIDGVSTVINKHGKAIVLEDDLITSPYFLQYCNDGLIVYQNTKQVFSINGFMFPINFECAAQTFLCPIATSAWGWATWADRWNQFEIQPEYINEIESNVFLRNRFNIGDHNYVSMLKNMNTWDIRWYYTAYVRNGLGLFPTRSLVKNIGFDGSGSHTGNEDIGEQQIYLSDIPVSHDNSIQMPHYIKVLNYFTNSSKPSSITRRAINKIIRFLK